MTSTNDNAQQSSALFALEGEGKPARPKKKPPGPPRPKVPDLLPDFDRMIWTVPDEDADQFRSDVERWQELYPAVDVRVAMFEAIEYAKAHPEKQYSRWYAYLSGWIRRSGKRFANVG